MKNKLVIAVVLLLLISMLGFAGGKADAGKSGTAATAYPTRNVNGIVLWGVGGTTDIIMRPLATLAEKNLGANIVVQNMTGGGGSIAAQYVWDAPADGYTLFMGAENPPLYKVLGISDVTYDNFDCAFLIGDVTVAVLVGKNSPYKTFTELINAAKARPGTMKLATTGKGGLPFNATAFITEVTGATFNQIPYDSDSNARTAVVNGECDFTVIGVPVVIEAYKAGDIKLLTVWTLNTHPIFPEVPIVVKEYPDFAKYLPWGPFYGIFVKKGTDPAIQKKIADAFLAASKDPSYLKVLENLNTNYLGFTGAEAQKYIDGWSTNTINALLKSGALN